MKISFYTLGCKVNQYETQVMAELLKNVGHTVVQNPCDADCVIINSCTVTAESDRKTRQAVRRFKRQLPNGVVVLVGCMPQAFPEKAKELLELVALTDVAKKKIKTYSGGMKQRIGIAQALLNNPEVLIVDEPTAGLDPKERVRFRNLMAEIGKDSIVLLSTHIVSDIEHIADEVLMMKDGQLIYQNKWEEDNGDLEKFYLSQFEEEGESL